MAKAHNVRTVRVGNTRGGWRRAPWIAAIVGAGLVLASCGTVPGAAATIDNTEISLEALHADTADTLAAVQRGSGGDTLSNTRTGADMSRWQLTVSIRHDLVQKFAERNGVSVEPGELRSVVQSMGLRPDLADTFGFDFLALTKYFQSDNAADLDVPNVTVTYDSVQVATADEAATARARYLADPAALAAEAADTDQTVALLDSPGLAAYGMFTSDVGDIVTWQSGNGGWIVARITDRQTPTVALTPDDVTALQQQLGFGWMDVAVLAVTPLAESSHIRVNPRFGVWDPTVVQVVPAP